jgi:hypothetical protein
VAGGDETMRTSRHAGIIPWLLLLGCAVSAAGQAGIANTPVGVAVVDENSVPVPDAQVVVQEPGLAEVRLSTDYAGHVNFVLQKAALYGLRVQKPGFYESVTSESDPLVRDIRVILNHEQLVLQEVSVTASSPGIDTEQVSDRLSMNLPEITNVPYPNSRDIRNLLPFYPGVVQDASGQIHVDGSETWATLDMLDSFDIRSPVSGLLAMRVSSDAVRSIDQESTRYPVQFGKSTGGVVAFYTGMGDNKFRFNTTDFLPSFQQKNGIQFDKFVPRLTFSGPLVRDRAWFFDGLEVEYDNNYISELPKGADTNHLIRGSNLFKAQANLTPANILTGGLLLNDLHSPFDGLSPLVPQQSTVKRDTIAWLPYLRDQQSFQNGALLDVGLGAVRFRDGYEPHGDVPFQITPELYLGSFFESLTSHSIRIEGNAALYLPTEHWVGPHNMKAGIDLDHIGFDETVTRAPVSYLREDGSLLRQSVFPATPPFTRHNVEIGAYVQDRWTPRKGLLLEPGLRFDWDEIIRRPLFSPRLAAVYAPPKTEGRTKVSAGVGLYYEHTQLEYLTRALAGLRNDTYFAADGVTPIGPPLATVFSATYGSLYEARALNWSIGVEQKIPGSVYLGANLIRKRVNDAFTYVNQTNPAGLAGNFTLMNTRQDNDNLFEIDARRTFARGYTLFGAYTHSSAHTNAAIDYVPTISMLGPQQSGPLPWDTPNRVISWGWVPFLLPWFKKNWDFVYTLDWHTGFPYTAVDANHVVVGPAGAQRFPNYLSLSPGLEWRFHFRGAFFGLRGLIENITDSENPAVVNNVVVSPQYGTFSEFQGRAITARIRLIGSKK